MFGPKTKSINKPNFFILGAGKSGTTSLYHYLKQHPDIFMSPVKEPSFFCKDFQVIKNPIEYFELFDSVKNETAIGEVSHAYLTNPSTAKVLKTLFSEAKFIVILRNPADRAYSLYHHMRRNGYEKINSFEKALRAEEGRVGSENFRIKCPQYYYNFLYFRSGLFGDQIERYFSFFDKNQFHFLTLDRLKTDPISSLKLIFKFLGINPDFKVKFQIHNKSNATTRLPLMTYFFKTQFDAYPSLVNIGKKVFGKLIFKEISPMRVETRKKLLNRYHSDLGKLYDLTGIYFQ
jgi:hypothetical protein